jgi:hypothetical protein
MTRDAHIPIFLWVATAALVHIMGGFEADQAASVLESQSNVRKFARSVAQYVRGENTTLEVALLDDAELERLIPPAHDAATQPEVADETEVDVSEPDPERHESDADQSAKERPVETKANELAPEPKKPEPQKPEQKKDEKAVQAEVLPLDRERRISVQQAVADNQPDNPNAEFIADRANHVEHQTQARITSSDENSPSPNPGTNSAPPADQAGNAPVTEAGQSDDSPGDPEKVPAESSRDGKDKEERSAQAASGGDLLGGEPARESKGYDPKNPEQARPESKGQAAQSAQLASAEQPDVVSSEAGKELFPGLSQETDARKARAAVREQRGRMKARKSPDLGGFGSLNTTPGGINPNLTPLSAFAAIGNDQLSRERRADGQRRRSQHRGSWHTMGLEKWRSAIENYVATVQPGNQTALNTARVPFASYLNRIHQRLHPVFAEEFLSSLDQLPRDNVLNQDLHTFLEIVVSRDDGHLVRMGVTRASGSTAFDVGALESVQRAAPFGPPPKEIVSPDGNVYLHWEFHRNPVYACSTYFARPYLLRVAPKPAPEPPAPAPPAQPEEGSRHGQRVVPSSDQDG